MHRQNNISNCETGIDVFHNAAENTIYNNTITSSKTGLGQFPYFNESTITSSSFINATHVFVIQCISCFISTVSLA
jgi:parallel beta-helix repeat protein